MVLRKEITLQIKDLLKENPEGLSITDIVKVVNINRNTAGRYLENLLVSGQVEMRRLGMAKIYMLSQRVPLSAVLSLSSELVVQLDNSLRIIFANEPFLMLVEADREKLLGKNIEYTPVALVFDDFFPGFLENIRKGLIGKEWAGEIVLTTKDLTFFCRIAPTVFDDGRKGVSVLLEDITEKKRTELTLQESEERYRQLVEISPDAVIIHQEGKISYINPAAVKLLGASQPDEIIGKNVLDSIHPDFHDSVMKNIEKDLKDEISPSLVLQMIRLDGTSIIVEGRGVRTSLGGKPAIQVAIRDISESKRAEAALHESEEKYRTLINQANDVISIVQDGTIKMCNPRLAEFWGGSIEEVLGKPFTVFIHPDALPEVVNRYNQRMAGESPPSIYETIFIRKDGSKSYVELNAGIISYEGRNADLVIVRDINERKKAEETLRESEATARALLNAPTDSVILIDCEGKILALNEIAASRFGKRIDELVGIMSYDILPKEVAQLRRSLMAPVLEKREMVRFVDQRDGIWYDTVAYPIVNESGDVKKIAIIARDVTEQKNIEKQLRKSEQMYKSLLEQSFDAIAIQKKGKITFLNERAAKVLGAAKPEDLIGRPIFDFIHPESRKNLEDRLKELSATEGMSAPLITEKFIRIDGSTVTIEVMAISFDDNGIPAFQVAFREISTP
jgi:PAS domain S-box-containing protein